MARSDSYKPETKKKIAEYRNKYNKSHYTVITIKLNNDKDKVIIKRLDKKGKGEKTDYIRNLILKDINHQK